MPNPGDDGQLDLRTSCTKNDAIAKLLGFTAVNPTRGDQGLGAKPYEQEHLGQDYEEVTIFDALADSRDAAQSSLDDARDEKDQPKIDECKRRVVKYDDLIRRAHRYACDLDDELALATGSQLRVDQQATNATGQMHIFLTSLDEWSQSKYEMTLLDALKSRSLDTDTTNDLEDARNAKGGLGRKSATSLYVTFAAMIECFVEKSGKQFGEVGSPNVVGLATLLSKQATPYDKLTPVEGQSVESIKGRIEKAIKTKSELLPK
jgi:hypothetical protein